MGGSNYNLIFTGKFIDGLDREVIHEKLSEILNMDKNEIQKKFSGQRFVITEKATKKFCLKMQEMVLFAGAECEIEKIASQSDDDEFII